MFEGAVERLAGNCWVYYSGFQNVSYIAAYWHDGTVHCTIVVDGEYFDWLNKLFFSVVYEIIGHS